MKRILAQGIEWETLNDEVKSLYRQGRYDRAVVVAKEALQVAEQPVGPNHPGVATSLENLAVLCRATQRDKEAEKLERRAAAPSRLAAFTIEVTMSVGSPGARGVSPAPSPPSAGAA